MVEIADLKKAQPSTEPDKDGEELRKLHSGPAVSLADLMAKSLVPADILAQHTKSLAAVQIADALKQSQLFSAGDAFRRTIAELQASADHSILTSWKSIAEKMALDTSTMMHGMAGAMRQIEEQTRRAMEMQKAFITPFQQLQEGIKAMYPAYVGLIEMTRDVVKEIKFVDPFAQIRERLISIPQFDFRQFAANIPAVLAKLDQFTEKDEKAVFDLFAKRGLTGMEEFLSLAEITHMLKLKKTKGSKAVDAYIFRLFRRNKFKALNAMVRAWWNVPYLKKRKTIILKAFRAHKKRDYELAIPTLLPLADGLSAEIVKGSPGLIQKKKTIYAKEAAALYRKQEPELWSVCFEQVVCTLVYKNYDPRSGKPPASSINRHGILHGSVLTYASELNSYRVIFLLNVMAKLAAKP